MTGLGLLVLAPDSVSFGIRVPSAVRVPVVPHQEPPLSDKQDGVPRPRHREWHSLQTQR